MSLFMSDIVIIENLKSHEELSLWLILLQGSDDVSEKAYKTEYSSDRFYKSVW